MSDTEEEWTTVRRRRGGRSGVSKQLKALAIPVVPLAFDALAEPEERPAQEATKAKKKKKGKKAKAADATADDEEEEDAPSGGKGGPAAQGKAAGKAGAAKTSSAVAAGGGGKAAQMSFFAWLLSRLVALLAMLGLMRAAGGSKKKRKSKTKAAATEETASPPAEAKQAAAAATPAKAAAPAPVAAKPAAAAEQALKQQQKPVPKATMPTPIASSATPAKKQAEPTAKEGAAAAAGKQAIAAAAKPAAAAVAAAAAMPLPAAVAAASATPATPVKPETAPAQAAEGKPKPAEPPPAPPTPVAPPPPAIKYDADWGRGKFVMQSLPTAHADVVSAVVLAGDVAVSAGYDGAVKLWHWPAPGTAGGGMAPRLAVSRVLVGHSGRVEALAAHAGSRRLATSGRDSTLKVWDLGSEPGGSGAAELASTYVYESVRSLAADWTGEGGAAAGRVLLGARSGTVMLYSLASGGAGRKVAALRGHEDEVTALQFLYGSRGDAGGQVAVSGARDGTVRLWDLRTAGGAATAVLTGLSGRVCSVSALGEHHLVAGDCSSTVKLWDLRQLPTRGSPPPPPRRLPNAPGFAGSSCPTAGLWHGPRSGVLLSSCIAWWTANKQALEEAPPNAKLPMACINVSAVGAPTAAAAAADPTVDASSLLCQYQYTLRLGLGVVTCLAGNDTDEGAVLAGGASGALWALRLVRGGSAAAAAAERAAAEAMAADAGGGSCEVVDALVVGAEEFSDDEYDDDEEDDEEEGEEE